MQCYVCFGEDEPLFRVCRCKSSVVHEGCFEEMVRRVPAHAARCPVCEHAYAVAVPPWWDAGRCLTVLLHACVAATWLAMARVNADALSAVAVAIIDRPAVRVGLFCVAGVTVAIPLLMTAYQLQWLGRHLAGQVRVRPASLQ